MLVVSLEGGDGVGDRSGEARRGRVAHWRSSPELVARQARGGAS